MVRADQLPTKINPQDYLKYLLNCKNQNKPINSVATNLQRNLLASLRTSLVWEAYTLFKVSKALNLLHNLSTTNTNKVINEFITFANECMAYKTLAMAVLISTLLVTAYTEGGGGTAPTCVEGCMIMCLKLNGATKSSCNQGCTLGCKQLQGKGPAKTIAAKDL